MEEINQQSKRKFFETGIKFGLIATAGTFLASKVFGEDKSCKTVELMTSDGHLVQVPASEAMEMPMMPEGYNPREGIQGKKFVMVIDLAKCKNALKCQNACNKTHYITGKNAWLKVYKMQESQETAPYWMPTICQHCDKPPCVKVCPVDATFKRKDGLVLIDSERCIGCRFCMAACPYSVRVFNWSEPNQGLAAHTVKYTPDYSGEPSIKGTVDKCDFCPHMIGMGELPHCVSACPNDVYAFGDIYEDAVTNGSGVTFKLSKLLKERGGHSLMEGLGTEPSVYYLPPTDTKEREDNAFEDGLKNYNEYESVRKNEPL